MTEKIIIITCLLTVSFFFYPCISHARGTVQNVTAAEFAKVLEHAPKGTILDIRTPGEFNQGHIAGAVNVDYFGADFKKRLSQLPRNKTYYVYCRTGNRSSKALLMMGELGFQNVVHLQDGILDWVRSGRNLK